MKHMAIGICWILGLLACACRSGEDGESAGLALTPEQRVLADQIISVFENDTPVIDYGYAENLDDGRGITAGRAGFTSATGDLLDVVERYTRRLPGNSLAGYLPRLRELAADESDAVDGLEGLEAAWLAAAADPAFRRVQDEVVDDEYYWPAVEHADALGLSFPLSLLCLYDTCIQHGDGEDPDGLPAILERATAQAGGAPTDSTDEADWLQAFLAIRRSVLLDPDDPETREAWAESVGRVDALIAILAGGKVLLTPPIVINPFGTTFTLPW
jgi:chitosanase